MIKNFLCSSLLFLSVFSCFAQQSRNNLHRELKWEKPIESSLKDDGQDNTAIKVLNFGGAQYNASNKFLPVFGETFEKLFDNSVIEFTAQLSNEIYEPLQETSLIQDPSFIGSSINIKTSVAYERKKPVFGYSFIPIRKNALTNVYEKLISFDIQFAPSKSINRPGNQVSRYYAPNSVLATGSWYKLGVNENGVYKITYDFLKQQLGLDVDNLDPRKIKLFGNGGGMLPEDNATPRPDDLVENAIEVVGESDGVFNSTDYILFYGQSADQWHFDASDSRFHHQTHLYCDTTYYFLTADLAGPSKRIADKASLTPGTGDVQINSFDDYAFHENNAANFMKSGRNFYGEIFDINLTQSFSFPFPNLNTATQAYYRTCVMARSYVTSSFYLKYQGQQLYNISTLAISTNYTDYYGHDRTVSGVFTASGPTITLDYTYNQPLGTSIGYLDYIELNVKRDLTMSGNQMIFRNKESLNSISPMSYNLTGYNSGLTIWDISDIYEIKKQSVLSSGNFITAPSGELQEFIAFNSINGFFTPRFHEKVANQNLHGLGQTDLIIVSYPEFFSEASRLADFHRTHDNLRVVVVNSNEVYNEFSSGKRDIAAIRDFTKMFYDRSATDMPRYLLLFGDGSYQNKNNSTSNTNFLPTYQSENSLSPVESYTSDDWFGFLDSLEGSWVSTEYLDIGIGRFPVKSLQEARTAVDKIIRYATPGTVSDPTACNSGNSTLGDWRNIVCFVADDEDGDTHINQADTMLRNLNPLILRYNVDKIYLDSYQQESTPGGARYPDVNDAINNRVNRGTLVLNYIGHGGELGWAHEVILNNSMINAWDNKFAMPLFITATCEFSRFDDPARTSAGENTFLNSNGGAIGLFTTTRLAFAFQNGILNKSLNRYMFDKPNGEFPRLGDIFRLTKRDPYNASSANSKNFTLLGDPALKLAYPKYDIAATKINGQDFIALGDTISALSKVTITGEIRDNGQKLTGFNGVIYPTIFDKATIVQTLGNDAASPQRTFAARKNILYKGKVSVINGDFTFTFIVPKDIAYNYGTGRLSFYAQNGTDDASGYYDSLVIGGISQNLASDNTGPEIKLYLNDEKFIFGGITNEHPKIYALLNDSNGVNTVGNGIGHDITATLDNKQENILVLNDYYESDLNSYQKGKLLYNLEGLSEGRHSLKLKVWDIYNNSSEAYTEFVVAPSAEIALTHVLNYPNPFTTHTSFFFEHNQACNDLDVQIQVYTVSGKLIKTINDHIVCEGYRSDKIDWDGKDDFGDRIGRGVYVYRLKVRTTDGNMAEKFEKLVVLR